MLDPQLPPPWREMWSWLGRDWWAKAMFHPRKCPPHPVTCPMACTACAVLLVLPLGRASGVLHPSSKILPHHYMWATGWKPGGRSRRSICDLEDQYFHSPGAKQSRGGKFVFFKSVFFSPAFFNTCSFLWYRQGLSPNPCPHPARGQTHLLPGRTVLQQQQVCEDAFMNSAVKMQSNAS